MIHSVLYAAVNRCVSLAAMPYDPPPLSRGASITGSSSKPPAVSSSPGPYQSCGLVVACLTAPVSGGVPCPALASQVLVERGSMFRQHLPRLRQFLATSAWGKGAVSDSETRFYE
jgi:hypothetical protein